MAVQVTRNLQTMLKAGMVHAGYGSFANPDLEHQIAGGEVCIHWSVTWKLSQPFAYLKARLCNTIVALPFVK